MRVHVQSYSNAAFFCVKSKMTTSTLFIALCNFTMMTVFYLEMKRTVQTTNKTINNK